MLRISQRVVIADGEIQIHAVRAQGPGGQNVNKVSTAIHLRFDIAASSLPELYKQRLLRLKDRRISREGIIIIKAQRYRSREKNRDDALQRLQQMIKSVTISRKRRKPGRPDKAAEKKRLDGKTRRGQQKMLRGKVRVD